MNEVLVEAELLDECVAAMQAASASVLNPDLAMQLTRLARMVKADMGAARAEGRPGDGVLVAELRRECGGLAGHSDEELARQVPALLAVFRILVCDGHLPRLPEPETQPPIDLRKQE